MTDIPQQHGAAAGAATSPSPGRSPSRSCGSGNGGGGPGIRMTREEVEHAFKFFDKDGTGVLKPRDLKHRLSAFYPHMSNKEYRFLVSEPNFTVETLWTLLESNTVTNFDPVREAFRVYDPNNTGFVDKDVLATVMGRMGYGEMTAEDMSVLMSTADIDGDGLISLEDFRNMLTFSKATFNNRAQ